MARDQAFYEAEKKIEESLRSGTTELNLRSMKLTELPESVGKLTQLIRLDLGFDYENEQQKNQLTALPDSLGQLTQLTELDVSFNQLTALPDSLGQLTQLTELDVSFNQLTALPDSLGQLTKLRVLGLHGNSLAELPDFFDKFTQLRKLTIYNNKLAKLPKSISSLRHLEILYMDNPLIQLPEYIRPLSNLIHLGVGNCEFSEIPDWVGEFYSLTWLNLPNNKLTYIPESIIKLKYLERLILSNNNIANLPPSLAKLEHLTDLALDNNPLNPALQSAYDQGIDAIKAYLRSLERNAEPLYEAKLVLVGEGNVGKTTLLKALKGKKGQEAPKQGESTTHGVEIDIHGLRLHHPAKDGIEIQLNAWDFGGQDVYRVTHQFFFSRRSLYLLVWEPRRGVQQGQVEDWLNMIRLRVGDQGRVIIVSTHCRTGERIARIDKPVFQQQYGELIVGFYEVDSLVPDETTGEMVGIAELKKVIAEESAKLQHMGMPFNLNWKAARDELVARPEPHISYNTFAETCARHGLSEIDTATLAGIMNDLGYIVHYNDDENLREDVVLKPEWLTKAIGFVLEDHETAKREGILPDDHLYKVWHEHRFEKEPRYDPGFYPFFLRLMEKYDVCYRLMDGKASLVAQHVPQVRPELPWLPEQNTPENLRRIAMVCAMEEDPPGLVPWMIVRTHDYAVEETSHRLHWDKGMFLRHGPHGEAMLEKRGREFHIYAQSIYPEYFMNVLQETLQKLIKDNWPGLEGRYRFTVPCPTKIDGKPCKGRFNIQALRQFISNGVHEYPCQECFRSHPIRKLLSGLEPSPIEVQLREINERLAGMDSRIAHYFMATMNAIASEAKNGPRLFTFRAGESGWSFKQVFSRPLELQLWCEAEGCQHPVIESGKGVYPIDQPREWFVQIAPYANFALNILKTVAPIAAPAINTFFGPETTETLKIADQLNLAKSLVDKLPVELKTSDRGLSPGKMLSEPERSGILALHRFLNEEDPTQERLGLHQVATYTGDYRWLCKWHYDAWQPNIPDVIKTHG